jgi:glucose 1-dehydrogenase
MLLQDKCAIVTGAGTGIGKAVAIALGSEGARVAVNHYVDPEAADDTVNQIIAAGGDALRIQADVSQPDQVARLAQTLNQQFGGIDILVNNAALQTNLGLMDYDEKTYDRVMDTNCLGYWLMMKAVVPLMRTRGGGRIINISSVHGKRPTDFDVAYAMSKGAIKMLSREAAIELAQYQITVNVIAPGAVAVGPKSGNPRPIVPPALVERMRARGGRSKFPLGRIGQPRDIAAVALFLASDQSEFLTGATIRADGGSMLL